MAKKILLLSASGLILLGLLVSCTLGGMSDVEFAKAVLKESGDATGLYPDQSKPAPSGTEGLSITIVPPLGEPPLAGSYEITITFTDYTPYFAANSIVNGGLIATASYDAVEQTVTIAFTGTLIVVGENAGEYVFDATLIIYLSTGDYEYLGTVKIADTIHEVSK